MVGDVETEIVAALNSLRAVYDFVFTTGGIGPTHDDITADAVAAAFGVGIGYHPEAYALLEARYPPGEFNNMRKRMARIPHGATLVANPVSGAPGFHIGNVYVMAGVPMVMRAMLEQIAPELPRGRAVTSVTVEADIPEGAIAPGLAQFSKNIGCGDRVLSLLSRRRTKTLRRATGGARPRRRSGGTRRAGA